MHQWMLVAALALAVAPLTQAQLPIQVPQAPQLSFSQPWQNAQAVISQPRTNMWTNMYNQSQANWRQYQQQYQQQTNQMRQQLPRCWNCNGVSAANRWKLQNGYAVRTERTPGGSVVVYPKPY